MLSKMAQPNNVGSGGGGSGAGSGSGRRLPLSLSGGSQVSRLQQSSTGSNGRSNSPQNGNNKKITESFIPLKKTTQQRTTSTGSSSSASSSNREDDKKSQNGATKSTNGKEKAPQNGSSSANKDQKESKSKDKVPEKKEKEPVVAEKQPEGEIGNKDKVVAEQKEIQSEAKKEVTTEATTAAAQPDPDVIILDNDDVAPEPTTPSKDRKSARKAASQQKSPVSKTTPTSSPVSKATPSSSPAQKKQTEVKEVSQPAPQEDVEMEPLTVDASPIRSASGNLNALPAATSTPGRSLFGFRSSSKQSTEVELATQTSSSPAGTPARTFAQISGRRSIRPINALTPSKVGSYRCTNSDLDTSSCTNASMNATVGSEIPNSSSFSFSFFGRGRKRERTPPAVSGSQSTNDLAQDVEMSPPKRARFEMFSLRNLASPFSLLSSKFSKATIATPTRLRLEQTPPGDDDGEVQNVSHIVVEEDNQLNSSSVSVPEAQDEEQANKDLTVGQEAGLETPKKGGSPAKEIPAEKDVAEGKDIAEQSADGENIPPQVAVAEVEARSRCSIM
ncbi:uncharacterized protein DDB_G0286299 [Drosophila kikkawai]|uniref:Uncharacterized protein DDB_G0286299 n=1 Tax=Drosophila kikkawai TaxID=30033 RepID=A0A6P4J2T4_DROKI|nr:muscle M-line assembly protein unc-89 [Drosophila kikkawai]XP_017035668.1 muscle M-line assembly protein unc-89 [Drosophila kikkawai]